MKKLTEKQKDALQYIYNDGCIEEGDSNIHKNTLNALYEKGLITYFTYANIAAIELTDKGLSELGAIKWINENLYTPIGIIKIDLFEENEYIIHIDYTFYIGKESTMEAEKIKAEQYVINKFLELQNFVWKNFIT